MYKDYFGLRETPFSIAPDPRYLYMSENHREALAHLLYGLNSEGGFVLLTGEVGTGKTTVCRCLLEQIPEDCETAFILNPRLTVVELLSSICDELHIRCPDGNTSIKVFVDLINARLLDTHARGSRTVLIIDEAQNLDTDVLEQLRLLTNLETNQRKLLQIILLGQPELRDKLALPELRQFAQRIIARYHLEPLTGQDVLSYVNHRLMVAGARTELFDPSSVRELYRVSGGIPRLINLVCDRALLGAYAEGKTRVDRDTLKKAAGELLGGRSSRSTHRNSAYRLVAACLLFMVCGAALSAVYVQRFRPTSAPAQPVVQEKASSSGMQRRQVPSSVKPAQAGEAVDASAAEGGSAPAVVPRPSGSLRQLADSPLSRGDHAAFQALFARWGISLQAQENVPACRQAEAQGLRCLSGQGGNGRIVQIEPAGGFETPHEQRRGILCLAFRSSRGYCCLCGRFPVGNRSGE